MSKPLTRHQLRRLQPFRAAPGFKIIRTVRGVVQWLGGPVAARKWAGYATRAGVDEWLRFDRIPDGFHHRLYLRARSRRVEILPSAFRLNPDGTPLMVMPCTQSSPR